MNKILYTAGKYVNIINFIPAISKKKTCLSQIIDKMWNIRQFVDDYIHYNIFNA